MSYVVSVGGDPINPNPFTYSQISMTGNITLVWPSNTQDATYTATDWIDITSSAAYAVTMPDGNGAGEGTEVVFYNYGSFTITVNDSTGGNITTVASGLTKRVWLTDNSTAAGTWRIANIGSGTTSADASMLAGYGLIAQAGQLSQSMQVASYSTNATLNAGVRSYLADWIGGAGTFTMTSPATLGNNWFVNVKNSGSGTLTINGNGATIDGASTIDVAIQQGFRIGTDGVAFYTIGRPIVTTPSITQLSKSVAGSADVTLTAAEAAYSIINFTGALTGNINVIVPANVNEWLMYNNTTGAYTLTVKTSGGSGVAITQGTRRLLYCDGTNVNFSDSVGTGTITSVATGVGLSGGPITTSGTISLANTSVVAGSYTIMTATVDAQGRITAASSGSVSSIFSALQTPTSAGSTLTLQAYDVDGASYTTFATLTANNTPTMDLSTAVTQGSAVIYRVGGQDVSMADGGTGLSSAGTAGNVLTSTGTSWTSSASTIPAAASQAQMEAGTSLTTYASPGRMQYHPGVAKAWVMYNGVTNSILASYNVTSVTDNGSGDFTINFTTAFSSANYGISGMCNAPTATAYGIQISTSTPPAAGACRINIVNAGSGALTDVASISVSFFGDQA